MDMAINAVDALLAPWDTAPGRVLTTAGRWFGCAIAPVMVLPSNTPAIEGWPWEQFYPCLEVTVVSEDPLVTISAFMVGLMWFVMMLGALGHAVSEDVRSPYDPLTEDERRLARRMLRDPLVQSYLAELMRTVAMEMKRERDREDDPPLDVPSAS